MGQRASCRLLLQFPHDRGRFVKPDEDDEGLVRIAKQNGRPCCRRADHLLDFDFFQTFGHDYAFQRLPAFGSSGRF